MGFRSIHGRVTLELESLGWNAHFESVYESFAAPGTEPARVSRRDRNAYVVLTHGGARRAALSRRLRVVAATAEAPTVGDWVTVDEAGVIHDVLPRATLFARKSAGEASAAQVVAANVDVAFVVVGLDGDFNARRIERYLALAHASGARAVVVLNKADACDDVESMVRDAEGAAGGAPVVAVSALDGRGTDALAALVGPGTTAAFLGSSGVGKSTLVNRLLGEERMATGAVREHDSRGRHTTTRRELVPLPGGGVLLDTPGMRELGLVDGDGIRDVFAEIEALALRCRFRDCAHGAEPGCAVQDAIDAGELSPERYRSYGKLKREALIAERRASEHGRRDARAEARGWGKMGRNAQRAKRARLGRDGW